MDFPFLTVSGDDRPERAFAWIHNPSAPATEAELTEFLEDFARLAETTEGGSDE